jgi:two-component system sensor histidine kinase FlrB
MSIVTSVRGIAARNKKSFYHPQDASTHYSYSAASKTPVNKLATISELAFDNGASAGPIRRDNDSSPRKVVQQPLASGLTVDGLLQALPTGVVILDKQGKVSQCNPAAEKLLGSGLAQEYWRDVIAANFNPRDDDGHEVSLISGKRVSLMTRSLLQGEGQLIVINDQTETRELQNQLNRHQRLSAMGQMMSSLAHQVRTPLTAALLHADNLTAANTNSPQIQLSGQKIISRLHNIERQIRDMLVFAKGGTTATSALSLNVLSKKLQDAAADLERSYGVKVQWQCAAEAAVLKCNPDALVGAFLNLLENAIQAGDRSLPIVAQIEVQGGDTEYHDSRVVIRVIDSGPGIDDAMLVRLAEPFNSTKPNGTGLGLAVVKLVCKSHGGEFKFVARNAGSCAEMSLPLLDLGAVL